MKRLVCLMLTLCLCMGCTAALADVSNVNTESVWPVVKDKVSVTIGVVPYNAGEYKTDAMWITEYWNDVTNLDIQWQQYDMASAKEKIPLILAGDQMPPALMSYSFNQSDLVQYGVEEGLFYPIDELLEYMPELSKLLEEKPYIRAAITAPDGHIYGLPNLGDMSLTSYVMRYFINNVWLQKINKDMPTTLDELYDVLCAFRDQDVNGNGDPNDEIPLCAAWNEGYSLRAFMLNAFGFCTSKDNHTLLYDADGNAQTAYIPSTEQYREYLRYMNKLWTDNLLDKDLFTQGQNQVNAKLTEHLAGLVPLASPSAVDPSQEYDYECARPLISEFYTGKPIEPKGAIIGNAAFFVINSQCDLETAAILANFADSFFNPYTDMLYKYGPTYSETETQETEYGQLFSSKYGSYFNTETNSVAYAYDESLYASGWVWRTTEMSFWSYPGYSCASNLDWEQIYADAFPNTMLGHKWAAIAAGNYVSNYMETSAKVNWIPYYTMQLPNFFYNAEDLSKVNQLRLLLDDYVAGAEAKFITGELSIENDWDAFQKNLKDYGVEEYAGLLAKYWEEYNK